MRIAICEDLQKDSDRLSSLLTRYLKINELVADVDVFVNGEALLDAFLPNKYNVIFQDIYMEYGGLTGIQVAEKVRKIDNEVAIIFITTSIEHGVDSYDVDAAYYIVKPIEKEKLEKAMDKCRTQIDRYARTIEIIENRQTIKIRLKDIYYAEVIKHNTLLHTVYGQVKTRTTLGEVAEKLDGSPFVYCHRSYIVNMVHIEDIKEKDFIMSNGDTIPISKTYQIEAKRALKEYFWENE